MSKLKEKEIDITAHWDHPAKVKIRRLTFGEFQDIQEEAIDTKGPQPKLKLGLYKTLVLQKTLVEAPFERTAEGIRGLDAPLGEFLFQEVDRFCSVDPKGQTPSSTPPSTAASKGGT